jgi:glutaredoxin
MLKHWLDERNIAYNEIKVDANIEEARKMIELSGQMGVPFTTIEHDDGTIDKVLGFDRPRFEQILQTA